MKECLEDWCGENSLRSIWAFFRFRWGTCSLRIRSERSMVAPIDTRVLACQRSKDKILWIFDSYNSQVNVSRRRNWILFRSEEHELKEGIGVSIYYTDIGSWASRDGGNNGPLWMAYELSGTFSPFGKRVVCCNMILFSFPVMKLMRYMLIQPLFPNGCRSQLDGALVHYHITIWYIKTWGYMDCEHAQVINLLQLRIIDT